MTSAIFNLITFSLKMDFFNVLQMKQCRGSRSGGSGTPLGSIGSLSTCESSWHNWRVSLHLCFLLFFLWSHHFLFLMHVLSNSLDSFPPFSQVLRIFYFPFYIKRNSLSLSLSLSIYIYIYIYIKSPSQTFISLFGL